MNAVINIFSKSATETYSDQLGQDENYQRLNTEYLNAICDVNHRINTDESNRLLKSASRLNSFLEEFFYMKGLQDGVALFNYLIGK